jgi:cell division protein FtsQ
MARPRRNRSATGRDRARHGRASSAVGAASAATVAATVAWLASRLKPLLRDWRRLAASAVALGALGAALWGAALLLDRPIRQVVVQGPFERVSVLQIEAAVGDLRETGFVSVQLDELRARLAAIDWVEDAIVRRRWPAEVEIIVVEQVPAARWGETGLLNTRGELFVRDARHVPADG